MTPRQGAECAALAAQQEEGPQPCKCGDGARRALVYPAKTNPCIRPFSTWIINNMEVPERTPSLGQVELKKGKALFSRFSLDFFEKLSFTLKILNRESVQF